MKKQGNDDAHVLIQVSREMRGKEVIKSVVIETEDNCNKAHIWQTTSSDFYVVLKENRIFTGWKQFSGKGSLRLARAFAKQFVLEPFSGGA